MSYANQLTGHYAEVRARLRGTPHRPCSFKAAHVNSAPVTLALPVATTDEATPQQYAPLNMLTVSSWRFLLALASARHGISQDEILGRSRQNPVVAARTEAIALVWQHSSKSSTQVGLCFGLDHTTILTALKRFGVDKKLVDPAPKKPRQRNSKGGMTGWGSAGRIAARDARQRKSEANHAVIRAGYAAGLSPELIAEQIGFIPKSVRTIAARYGLTKGGQNAQ
ncbi:MAG: hypothetical protein EOO81_12975 [Oxalobacteraceae bacterium]|nr:MAG: hypothetical protein EOO81_12975 [Oxalobacteraceae bacterium]